MKRILSGIASFFRQLADLLDGGAKPAQPRKIIDKRMRLRTLLSRDDLAVDEQRELADLVSQFEGNVIFLDSPVHATAKEDL